MQAARIDDVLHGARVGWCVATRGEPVESPEPCAVLLLSEQTSAQPVSATWALVACVEPDPWSVASPGEASSGSLRPVAAHARAAYRQWASAHIR